MPTKLMIGIDEAGCGCIAGRMFASIVALKPDAAIPGVKDSKKLSERQREELVDAIWETAEWYEMIFVEPARIDQVGLGQAWLAAVRQLADDAHSRYKNNAVILDGNREIQRDWVQPIVKADDKYLCVAAASVLSKYLQTCCMEDHHERYPLYGFMQHKGYPTAAHLAAIKEHGPCPIHRMSFRPLQKILLETRAGLKKSST